MSKKKTKQKNKIKYLTLIIALIIILSIYIINRLIFIRPIMWFIAIILITIFFKQFYKIDKKGFITMIVLFFFVSIVVDGIIVTVFKRVPAYTYNVVSSDKVNIYYSPGLRVWQCNKESYKKLIVDKFYNNGYVCDVDDIGNININSFLSSVVENYSDYGNKYVKVTGKISKKNSQVSIEMRPYIESEIKVNGYVEFADSIVLKIFFDKSESILDEYDIYDDITIIGLVKNLEGSSGNYVIYMDEARVVSTTNVSDYSVSITPEKKCSDKTLLVESKNKKVYSYCLSEVFVSYDDTTSELSDVISSGKVEIDNLYADYSKIESDNQNKIYRMENYSILVCKNEKDVIIGKKNMKFTDTSCE